MEVVAVHLPLQRGLEEYLPPDLVGEVGERLLGLLAPGDVGGGEVLVAEWEVEDYVAVLVAWPEGEGLVGHVHTARTLLVDVGLRGLRFGSFGRALGALRVLAVGRWC